MAKLNRETKLHEKRVQKQARKAARKLDEASDAAEAPAYEGPLAALDELDASLPEGEAS